MSEPTIARRTAGVAVLGIGALSAVLLLANLGNQYLWQDEAQTALIAGTILTEGIPHGTDGVNFFSQELGAEYGENHVWRWHTWLSFYLVSGSFALFGPGTFSTRLPFALLGIGTVWLTYAAGVRLWRDPRAAIAGAFLLTLCVPFLLLHRQGRWYAAASFFSLLGLYCYTRLGKGAGWAGTSLFVSLLLLFHTHYLYAATLLASICLHAVLCERARLRRVCGVTALVILVGAPWIVWLSGVELGEHYASRLGDPSHALKQLHAFAAQFSRHFFAPLFLLAPLLLLADRWRRREPLWEMTASTRSHALLLILFIGLTLVALGGLAPGTYFRYLAPLAAPAFLLLGILVGSLWRRSRLVAAAMVAAWVASGSLHEFAYEITHDFDGPIEGIVEYLKENADAGDTVAITYGDLPVKFYTGLRVVGGLTGEDVSEAKDARFIIVRRHKGSPEERRLEQAFAQHLSPQTHRGFALDYPDTAFENREDPALHRFRTERPTFPRVVVYEARR
jgi:hypothetical protein